MLEHIGGIAAYPIVSLTLFVLVFAGVVVWALGLKRADVEHLRQLPLQEDGTFQPEGDARS
ncbi:MAG: cbb3-type cytochrome c oxidase subunit 3 [Lentisphaerae bacterium]|nr:cbb3-type cytochrome c oxidase subunit 3 [Lentisphaerota bacterium]